MVPIASGTETLILADLRLHVDQASGPGFRARLPKSDSSLTNAVFILLLNTNGGVKACRILNARATESCSLCSGYCHPRDSPSSRKIMIRGPNSYSHVVRLKVRSNCGYNAVSCSILANTSPYLKQSCTTLDGLQESHEGL